jgi:hypothetical protein
MYCHESVDYGLLETMFDHVVVPLDPAEDPRMLPAIGFKPDRDYTVQPNVHQMLNEEDYRRQRERYDYQFTAESGSGAKKSIKDLHHGIRQQAERLEADGPVRETGRNVRGKRRS